MSSAKLHRDMLERSLTFVDRAQEEINKIMRARTTLALALQDDKTISIDIQETGAKECLDVYLGKDLVLTVINRYTFPVTPVLDSPRLSREGKLDGAIDVRPFMFSGPAPTMVIWAGTGKDTIEEFGYPTLTQMDAEAAFRYWIHYIFGLTLTADWRVE